MNKLLKSLTLYAELENETNTVYPNGWTGERIHGTIDEKTSVRSYWVRWVSESGKMEIKGTEGRVGGGEGGEVEGR